VVELGSTHITRVTGPTAIGPESHAAGGLRRLRPVGVGLYHRGGRPGLRHDQGRGDRGAGELDVSAWCFRRRGADKGITGPAAQPPEAGTARDDLAAQTARGRALPLRLAKPRPVNPHWPRNVLDCPLAEIVEAEPELVEHLVAHIGRDADAARVGDAFEPRRDVDAVAVDVVAIDDDVAD
jgi:hypothetical protein